MPNAINQLNLLECNCFCLLSNFDLRCRDKSQKFLKIRLNAEICTFSFLKVQKNLQLLWRFSVLNDKRKTADHMFLVRRRLGCS